MREHKTDKILNPVSIDSSAKFQMNDYDETTTADTTYFGNESATGEWWIVRLNEATSKREHASITTDPTRTTYLLAWTNRESLSYTDYGGAF